jgi:pimeloyl-ACP methyl ester carboxylesterase
VAARFALDHPDRLIAAVFNLPHYPGADIGPSAYQREQLGGVAALAARALSEGMGVMDSAYAGLPDGVREAALAMVHSFDPGSYATTAAFLASGAQPFATAADLAAITVPVLILPGDDPMHPAETSALYARHMPHAQVGGDLAAFLKAVTA